MEDIENWCNISFGDYYANPLRYAHNLYIDNELITELVIPDNVTEIKPYVFHGCTSITSVIIPDSVTTIGSFAFLNCSSLINIAIPESVTTMDYGVFSRCSSLTSVIIGNSVISIDSYVFNNCDSLTTVYYKGTVNEWKNISISDYGNTKLTNATRYYYSETEPEVNNDGTAYNGNYWHYDTDGVTPIIWKKEK